MARRHNIPPLVEHPHSDWNRLRLRAGLSLRDLETRTGVRRSQLSLIDQGRLTPTDAQSTAILAVLRPEHPAADPLTRELTHPDGTPVFVGRADQVAEREAAQ